MGFAHDSPWHGGRFLDSEVSTECPSGARGAPRRRPGTSAPSHRRRREEAERGSMGRLIIGAGAALGAATIAFVVGCTPPPSAYRYTAVVPAARPPAWDGRTATDGSLRLDGTATHTTTIENL